MLNPPWIEDELLMDYSLFQERGGLVNSSSFSSGLFVMIINKILYVLRSRGVICLLINCYANKILLCINYSSARGKCF